MKIKYMNKLRGPIRSVKLITLLLAQVLLTGCQTYDYDGIVPWNPPICQGLYFVDAHSQVEKFIDTESEPEEEMTADEIKDFILQKMGSVKVARSILYPRAGQSHDTIVNISDLTSGTTKIYPAIAVKGNYYSYSYPRLQPLRLQQRIDSGKFHALGEVLLYHEEKPGIDAGEVVMYPTNPEVQYLYQVAKQEGWPLILHIEDAAMSRRTQIQMYRTLCRVGLNLGNYEAHSLYEERCTNLYQNELDMTDHPVVFIHMAQLPPDRVEWILDNNENVHFMISHSNPISAERKHPWINMFSNGEFSPSWRRLLKKYPKRFIFALDNVTQDHWTEDYEKIVELWHKALNRLPDSAAHDVAHGNAERLWGIPPSCYPADNTPEVEDNYP
ncbi:MAG: hypothetical protein U9N50_09650 [Pseudomonadota bacterium]|nr:hypothetical protein [Pseudomonadota bacterium]